MTEEQLKATLKVLEDACTEAKRAYYANERGASYDDMRAAAARVLRWRQTMERALYGRVRTRITPAAVSSYLR